MSNVTKHTNNNNAQHRFGWRAIASACRRSIAVLGVALCFSTAAIAAEPIRYEVKIVTADKSEYALRIADTLAKTIPGALRPGDSGRSSRKRPCIYLTVGPKALKETLNSAEVDSVIISLFTSSLAFRGIAEGRSARSGVTAIYADPSPLDQFRLISLIHKRAVRVAALVSDKTEYLIPLLKQGANSIGAQLQIEHVGGDVDVNRAMRDIVGIPILLATPDGAIYNAESIKSILISSYRSDQYVVGFSSAMVNAGALATVKSDIGEIAEQAKEVVSEIDAGSPVPEAQYPKYFSVDLNDAVARSLNVVIDDKVRNFSRKPGRGN
jgi:ABC-type uncharacterized transport system substrate-binding protein